MAATAAPAAPDWLRLRQVCLVAVDLALETDRIRKIFGLEVCYRDPNVARYGLENVLFPVGTDFIEIVSPVRPGTAAGRFLERHEGRHGYMIIMDCADPAARQLHCASMGVRTANLIRHADYLGVQLHPKDTGGAMLEFNRTRGGDNPMGPYSPAGADWQKAIRSGVTQRMLGAEIECPDPAAFSARWGDILQKPSHAAAEGRNRIALDSGALEFLPTNDVQAVLAGIELQVVDREKVAEAAKSLGCVDARGDIRVCGVRFRLHEVR